MKLPHPKSAPSRRDLAMTHALSIMSIGRRPTTLKEIIGSVDFMNHGILTCDELNHSLGWLMAKGFIAKEGAAYRLTDDGLHVIQVSRQQSRRKTLETLAASFEPTALDTSPVENITPQEHLQAYEKYQQEFWQTAEDLKRRGEI